MYAVPVMGPRRLFSGAVSTKAPFCPVNTQLCLILAVFIPTNSWSANSIVTWRRRPCPSLHPMIPRMNRINKIRAGSLPVSPSLWHLPRNLISAGAIGAGTVSVSIGSCLLLPFCGPSCQNQMATHGDPVLLSSASTESETSHALLSTIRV